MKWVLIMGIIVFSFHMSLSTLALVYMVCVLKKIMSELKRIRKTVKKSQFTETH